MPYFVYILQSEVNGVFYKGITNDLDRRFKEHNNREEKSTSRYAPWNLVWKCEKPSKSEAVKLERKLKNLSRQRLMDFIDKYPVIDGIGGPDVTAYRQSGFRPSPRKEKRVIRLSFFICSHMANAFKLHHFILSWFLNQKHTPKPKNPDIFAAC